MEKRLEQKIISEMTKRLGRNYIDADLHSDDIDNAASDVAAMFGLDEDDIRYVADLPR